MPDGMVDPHRQIAELEARIEELYGAAERCRRIMAAARVAIAAGGLLLMSVLLGLFRPGPMAFVAALATVLAGIVLLGSNRSTLDEIMARIKTHEARRARMIDGLGLQAAKHGPSTSRPPFSRKEQGSP